MRQTDHQRTEADAPTRQVRMSLVAVTSEPWRIRAEGCNRRFVPLERPHCAAQSAVRLLGDRLATPASED
jgi:hypothetical protein